MSSRTGTWRRIGVATRSFVIAHLEDVTRGTSGPAYVVLPSLLVVPDAAGEQLREIIAQIMQRGGLDHWSTPVAEGG